MEDEQKPECPGYRKEGCLWDRVGISICAEEHKAWGPDRKFSCPGIDYSGE